MSTNRTGVPGIERRARDYRGQLVPEGLPQHLMGVQVGGVLHTCPECGVRVRPLCPVCLGDGRVTVDRLDRYQIDLERQVAHA